MAKIRWTGGAPAIAQVTTVTIANTWATNDTVTLTIGTKQLIVTIGSAFATTDVAAALNAAIMATTPTSGLIGNESRNVGGQQIPEFTEIQSTVLGSVVTITSVTAGTPFTIAATESTAGTGTATGATVTAATGPNHFDNPKNFDTGTLPVDNDDLYIDTGSVDIFYGLTYYRTNSIDLNWYFTNDWTGSMGLPPVHPTLGYFEYRQRLAQFRGLSKTISLEAGLNGNTNGGTIRIDLQDQSFVSIFLEAARNANTATPSIYLSGSHTTTAHNKVHIAEGGSVSIEDDGAGTNSAKYFQADYFAIGAPNSQSNTPVVYIGKNMRLAKSLDIQIYSGTTYSESPTDDTVDSQELNIVGGTFYMGGVGSFDGAHVAAGATLVVTAEGSMKLNSFFTINGGTLDFRKNGGLFPAGAALHKGSTLFDPSGTHIAAFDLVGCTPNDITHSLPASRNWAHSPLVY